MQIPERCPARLFVYALVNDVPVWPVQFGRYTLFRWLTLNLPRSFSADGHAPLSC